MSLCYRLLIREITATVVSDNSNPKSSAFRSRLYNKSEYTTLLIAVFRVKADIAPRSCLR